MWCGLAKGEKSKFESQAAEKKREYDDAVDRFRAACNGRIDLVLSLLALADMYQIPELLRTCFTNIVNAQEIPVRAIVPMVRAIRGHQAEPEFAEIWKRLHVLVGKRADAFEALCSAV